MIEVYPLFLLLRSRLVVVVGGGEVAERKVEGLLAASALVRVVSPSLDRRLEARSEAGAIDVRRRAFDEADVEDAWLVVACTDDPSTQERIASACERRRTFCLAVDDIQNATAFGGSVIRRPPFTIALSSSGEAPALTRLLREVLEATLPPDSFVARARALRKEWKERGVPMQDRFAELLRAAKDHLSKSM